MSSSASENSESRGTGYLRDSVATAIKNIRCGAVGYPNTMPKAHHSEWLNDQVVFPTMDVSKDEILTVSIESRSEELDPAVLCINGPRLGKYQHKECPMIITTEGDIGCRTGNVEIG